MVQCTTGGGKTDCKKEELFSSRVSLRVAAGSAGGDARR